MGGQPRLAQNKPETVGKTGQKASKAAGSRITYTTILPIIIFRRNQRQETIKSLGVATQPILYSQKKKSRSSIFNSGTGIPYHKNHRRTRGRKPTYLDIIHFSYLNRRFTVAPFRVLCRIGWLSPGRWGGFFCSMDAITLEKIGWAVRNLGILFLRLLFASGSPPATSWACWLIMSTNLTLFVEYLR